MPHKVNISDSGKYSLSEQELSKGKSAVSDSSSKGKTFKLELEDTGVLSGKSIGDAVKGEDVDSKLAGFELEIMGGSDKSGFPMCGEVEGIGLKKVLFKEKGWGMHDARKGVRLRKSVRGKTISGDIVQVNLAVVKSGGKLEDLFGKKEEGDDQPAADSEGDNAEQPGGDSQDGGAGNGGDAGAEKAEEKKEE
ncbi:hypothetical protein CMI48_01205 [Candidatus Pacearchaeota archaeon]|jgi:small subunit ribosomal protein S6e|nr:hypothetical protein [Candidatus Pacearchaeota archaeon]